MQWEASQEDLRLLKTIQRTIFRERLFMVQPFRLRNCLILFIHVCFNYMYLLIPFGMLQFPALNYLFYLLFLFVHACVKEITVAKKLSALNRIPPIHYLRSNQYAKHLFSWVPIQEDCEGYGVLMWGIHTQGRHHHQSNQGSCLGWFLRIWPKQLGRFEEKMFYQAKKLLEYNILF